MFLYNLSYYMCYLNSSLNPFAYALGSFFKLNNIFNFQFYF